MLLLILLGQTVGTKCLAYLLGIDISNPFLSVLFSITLLDIRTFLSDGFYGIYTTTPTVMDLITFM